MNPPRRQMRRAALLAHRLLGTAVALLLIHSALAANGAGSLRLALWLLVPTVLAASLALVGGTRPAGWVLLHLNLMLIGLLCTVATVRLALPGTGMLAVVCIAGGIAAALASGRR